MKKKKILVIGSLNMDWVIPVNHMPKEGETILAESYIEIPGGKGANQALAVKRLGGSVTMLGMVGDDTIGEKLISNLATEKIDTTKIEEIKQINSGLALIYVSNYGSNSIVVLPGANSRVDKNYIDKNIDVLKDSDIIVLQMEIPEETVYYIIEKAHEMNKIIILNPAPAPEYLKNELYDKIDFLTPNETELEKLTGILVNDINGAIKASKILLSKGIRNIIATLGENGALLVNKDTCVTFRAEKVKAVDTTAAGDCFNGAFAVALGEGYSLEQAIQFANKAASISVTRKGAQPSIPFINEMKSVL
ncbi:ribokinase [Clostridium fungisolvens]|uniref:Ribokinase n=1 Tax=Clostridium fungisolvens TaxID=1604897 RepID=A0A6V8SH93_9CLOT|nr:Ribokinase [Clostridium fungisolvens]